jgi:hypothetical protein
MIRQMVSLEALGPSASSKCAAISPAVKPRGARGKHDLIGPVQAPFSFGSGRTLTPFFLQTQKGRRGVEGMSRFELSLVSPCRLLTSGRLSVAREVVAFESARHAFFAGFGLYGFRAVRVSGCAGVRGVRRLGLVVPAAGVVGGVGVGTVPGPVLFPVGGVGLARGAVCGPAVDVFAGFVSWAGIGAVSAFLGGGGAGVPRCACVESWGCGEDFGHGGGGAREGCVFCRRGRVVFAGCCCAGGRCTGCGCAGRVAAGWLPAWGGVRVTVLAVCGGGGLGVVLGGGWLCWRGFWGCGVRVCGLGWGRVMFSEPPPRGRVLFRWVCRSANSISFPGFDGFVLSRGLGGA